MRNKIGFFALALLVVFVQCKSNFEKIRNSGDPELLLKNAFHYYEKEDYSKAKMLFEQSLNYLRGRPDGEKAYYYFANCHYELREYVLASYYYKNFTNTFTNSAFREEAAFKSAYCNYLMSPTFRLEQSNTEKAIEEFQLFVNLYPESAKVPECNKLIDECRRKLEEKAYHEGELYYKMKQYQSAMISFDNLLKDYPESPEVENVQYLIAKSAFNLAENSVVDKKIDRYDTCILRCEEFVQKHKQSSFVKEVEKMARDSKKAIAATKKQLAAVKS